MLLGRKDLFLITLSRCGDRHRNVHYIGSTLGFLKSLSGDSGPKYTLLPDYIVVEMEPGKNLGYI